MRPEGPWVRLPLRPDLIMAVRHGRKTVTRRVPRRDGRPPCRDGDLIGFTESIANRGGLACYVADASPVTVGGAVRSWEWKVSTLSARYCPNEAVRTWARVVSVTCPELRRMTNAEAIREGFDAQHRRSPLERFQDVWRELHKAWDPMATPWRIEFAEIRTEVCEVTPWS